jgi:hypothetical protein
MKRQWKVQAGRTFIPIIEIFATIRSTEDICD